MGTWSKEQWGRGGAGGGGGGGGGLFQSTLNLDIFVH